MKKKSGILLLSLCFVVFSSCRNSTKKLLVKTWDCVKVDNLAPVNKQFLEKEDSLVTARLEAALQNLSWSFNADNSYRCSTGGITTVEGTYSISDDGRQITCITSKNNINHYGISTLTEAELVLQGYTASVPVILYFRPH